MKRGSPKIRTPWRRGSDQSRLASHVNSAHNGKPSDTCPACRELARKK